MKSIAFLTLWCLSYLPSPGGPDRSTCPVCSVGTVANQAHTHAPVVRRARRASLPEPCDRKGYCLAPIADEEEESPEGAGSSHGVLLSRLWRSLGPDAFPSHARAPHDLAQITSRLHPLRC